MIGKRLGDWEVVARLGAGAMGTVYLGESDAGRVALKVLHSHLVEQDGFFRRFEREAALGLTVRHDNVVRVLDYDLFMVDGNPACVVIMEYVEGRTLRRLMTELGTVPEALLREIALQIAEGLAAIHEKGAVHRDVKPENVLITDDHRVRIMDLGVARTSDASFGVTDRGGFAGTLTYAAPEQLLGEPVTPAADLYSLGVTLYELASGENPFRREHPAAIIEAHVNSVPPRLADRVKEVSVYFSELVATMLEKDPASRPGTASTLSEILTAGEYSRWWSAREAMLQRLPASHAVVPVRRETRHVGREAELATLRQALDAARRGEGGSVLIQGEAGLGKSRLVDEFVRSLPAGDVRVLYGSYSPSGGEGALSAAILDAFGREALGEKLRRRILDCSTLAPAFAAFLRHEPVPAGGEALNAGALHTVFARLAQGLARETPLLWIVEDLQYAPEADRGILFSLVRAVAGHRALVLGTTTPGVPGGFLERLSGLVGVQRLELSRLSQDEVMDLLRDDLRSERLAERVGERVVRKADGVPLFVFEMLRGLVEGRYLTRSADGTWVESKDIREFEVPSSVRDLIAGRLRDLTDEERALLDVASVDGFEFDVDLMARVRHQPRVRVLERLTAIERRHGVVRSWPRGFRFDHHLVEEVLYGQLPGLLREEVHLGLATALEERSGATGGDPADLDGPLAARLCEHFVEGGQGGRAVRYLGAAMKWLGDDYQHDRAIALADRLLEADGLLDGEARLRVLLQKEDHLDLLGRRKAQRAVLEEARTLAESATAASRRRFESAMGCLLRMTGQPEEARIRFEKSLVLARECGDRRGEAGAWGNLGNTYLDQGRLEEARERYQRQLDTARECGNAREELMGMGNLGTIHRLRGCGEEARRQYEEQLDRAQRSADRRGEAMALGNLGSFFFEQGRYQEAHGHFEKALAIARAIGHRVWEAGTRGNLGNVFRSQGEFSKARVQYERQHALAQEIGDPYFESLAQGSLGNLCRDMGRYEEAREHQEKSLAIARSIGHRQQAIGAMANLGIVFSIQGRGAEGLQSFESALSLARELGDAHIEAGVLQLLGAVRRDIGDLAGARSASEAALTLARKIGARNIEAFVLQVLSRVAGQEGEPETARSLQLKALALRRELGARSGLADSLIALAELEDARGDGAAAIRHAEEAALLAGETQAPEHLLLTTVLLARLRGGDAGPALDSARDHGKRVPHAVRVKVAFDLWLVTGDRAHLEEAYRLLCFAREHAPEDYRDSMIENVPVHRDIMEAWRAAGGVARDS